MQLLALLDLLLQFLQLLLKHFHPPLVLIVLMSELLLLVPDLLVLLDEREPLLLHPEDDIDLRFDVPLQLLLYRLVVTHALTVYQHLLLQL